MTDTTHDPKYHWEHRHGDLRPAVGWRFLRYDRRSNGEVYLTAPDVVGWIRLESREVVSGQRPGPWGDSGWRPAFWDCYNDDGLVTDWEEHEANRRSSSPSKLVFVPVPPGAPLPNLPLTDESPAAALAFHGITEENR